ncbi:MAG: CHAT domain-containing protein [Gemmatimonas sp.]
MTSSFVDVGIVESVSDRPRSQTVVLLSSTMSMFGSAVVTSELFDAIDQARSESGALYAPLSRISQQVALQEKMAEAANPDATVAQMLPALTMSKAISQSLLNDLRTGGASLRDYATQECRDKFRFLGVNPGRNDEPALTFQESANAPHILWDLWYDAGDTLGEVKWESFWGFRLPISHWVMLTRDRRPRIREGLFGGLHEALPFAAREFDEVAERIQCSPRKSTADFFHQYVKEALVASAMSEADADAWLLSHKDEWLAEFLLDGPGKPADAEQWKKERLIQMLRALETNYDLLHFACHSTCNPVLASQSKMTMKVGGQELAFLLSTMKSNLKSPVKAANDPGPIIFLNACRTADNDQPYEPSPFATSLIMDRGALAVVSPICPVPDFFARAFALKYYDFLLGRDAATFGGAPVKGSLSGALLATRRYFMEQHQNPLGLAYVLYASPGARLAPTVQELSA